MWDMIMIVGQMKLLVQPFPIISLSEWMVANMGYFHDVEIKYFKRDRNMQEFVVAETQTVMKKRGCDTLDREGIRILLEVIGFILYLYVEIA